MSQIRQELVVRALGLTLPDGHALAAHAHDWAQLVYGVQGVITARTDHGVWVVPPMRALLVPAGVAHAIETTGVVAMRTLYFHPRFSPTIQSDCTVVAISPLLRELIVSIVESKGLNHDVPIDRTRLDLLMQLLTQLPAPPLGLPVPSDPRAKALATRILASVGAQGTLTELARGSGASARTIERAFLEETGLTFGRWRQQARLLEALRLLGLGTLVSSVAQQVGYRSTSAFVATFRRAFGTTPARYFDGPDRYADVT